MLRSNGDGTFTQETWSNTTRTCFADPEALATAGDVNGDGQDDLTCITQDLTSQRPRYALWSQPSPVATPRHRWMPLDENGDGRQDLVYVHYTNRAANDALTVEAYHVYLLHGQANGTYQASERSILPLDGVRLNNPAATDWLPIDVGGDSGRPDGRSDLVLLDRDDTGAVRTITLLSSPTGWVMHANRLQDDSGQAVSLSDADLRSWRPATLNRSGKTDLVHFDFADPGVRLRWLTARGDGGWTAHTATYFGSAADGGPLTRPDVSTFRAVDDNLDGLTDFRYVDVDTGATPNTVTVRTLISTRPGQWLEETKSIAQSMEPGAAHRLRSIDFNGDHVPDLGLPVLSGGCLRIQAFLRLGSTWSNPQLSQAPQQCAPSNRSNLMNVVLGDVNHDDKTDLYRMSSTGPGMYTQLNPGNLTQPWLEVPQPPVQTTPDSWAWFPLDTDHDGTAQLAHTGGSLETLTWLGDDGRITGIDNGRGAVTTVAYHAQAESRLYLPVGTLPIVVGTITLTDHAYTPANQSAATFTYADADWSHGLGRMTGYKKIDATQGPKVVHTTNDLSDSCGARKAIVEISDTAGSVFNRTTTEFETAGATAPYTCLPNHIKTDECELTATCRISSRSLEYDPKYGTTTAVEESTPDGRRRTQTTFTTNPTAYIVNKPSTREIQVPGSGPGGWDPQTRTLYAYDKQPPDVPPTRGDLNQVTEITDLSTDTRSTTTYEYDDVGNVLTTTNPVRVVTTESLRPGSQPVPRTHLQCPVLHRHRLGRDPRGGQHHHRRQPANHHDPARFLRAAGTNPATGRIHHPHLVPGHGPRHRTRGPATADPHRNQRRQPQRRLTLAGTTHRRSGPRLSNPSRRSDTRRG